MDLPQAAPYQNQLLEKQAMLLAQIAAQRGGTVGRAEVAAAHFAHPEDSQAQLATERELEFALNEHEIDHLNAIEAALNRISAGTYGQCTDCGSPITAARLQATPEASRCIHCQGQVEKHHPA
ncbi:MAG: TraR/DksA C4-type zinc finger protein [Burkholderiaceae bacterium]|nr:TraR/DksA C4-type zinc finger protein [Burkholderiaceae bacterium]